MENLRNIASLSGQRDADGKGAEPEEGKEAVEGEENKSDAKDGEEVKDEKESKAGTASKKTTPISAKETPAATPSGVEVSQRSKVIEGQKSLANLTASQGSRAGSLDSKVGAPGVDPFAFNIES